MGLELSPEPNVTELNQEPNGHEMQQALAQLHGMRTVPQVFVNGTLVGGWTETSGAHQSGELQKLLQQSNAAKL